MPKDCNGVTIRKNDYVVELGDSRMCIVTKICNDNVIITRYRMIESGVYSVLVRKLSKEEVVLRKFEL